MEVHRSLWKTIVISDTGIRHHRNQQRHILQEAWQPLQETRGGARSVQSLSWKDPEIPTSYLKSEVTKLQGNPPQIFSDPCRGLDKTIHEEDPKSTYGRVTQNRQEENIKPSSQVGWQEKQDNTVCLPPEWKGMRHSLHLEPPADPLKMESLPKRKGWQHNVDSRQRETPTPTVRSFCPSQ